MSEDAELIQGLDNPRLDELFPLEMGFVRESIELMQGVSNPFDIEKFFSALFAGVDARTQERIMERIQTIHKILFPNVTKDYAFMCAEVMWVVLTEEHELQTAMPIYYNNSYDSMGFCVDKKMMPEFTEYMKAEWTNIDMSSRQRRIDGKTVIVFLSQLGIPQVLMWYLWNMYPRDLCVYEISTSHPQYAGLQQNIGDLRKYVDLLKIIK